MNGEDSNTESSQSIFKKYTNLPVEPGARVMFLNNDLINEGAMALLASLLA